MCSLKKNSLFVIVPALNEEKNIGPTVEMVREAAKIKFGECHIAIFNDGSRDRTGEVAERLAKSFSNLQVIHHDHPKGLGYCYKEGVRLADCEYVIMVPGDNEGLKTSFEKIFSFTGQAEIVIPHTSNPYVRPVLRRLISSCFVLLLNALFKLRLRYYNGCVLHRTEIINSIEIKTDSFAYQAEALIKLIRKGRSYVEVGVPIQERPTGNSKAFRLKNVKNVVTAIWNLVGDIYG